jgi:hypothetical protein
MESVSKTKSRGADTNTNTIETPDAATTDWTNEPVYRALQNCINMIWGIDYWLAEGQKHLDAGDVVPNEIVSRVEEYKVGINKLSGFIHSAREGNIDPTELDALIRTGHPRHITGAVRVLSDMQRFYVARKTKANTLTPAAPEPVSAESTDSRIGRAIQIMVRDHDHKLSDAGIARAVGLSPSSLSRAAVYQAAKDRLKQVGAGSIRHGSKKDGQIDADDERDDD